MVFPFPRISLLFKNIPMTWFLVGLNIFMFTLFSPFSNGFKSQMTEILEDEYFYKTQAKVYKSHVAAHPERYGFFTKNILNIGWGGSIKSRIISSLALSDSRFTTDILSEEITGDAVANKYWRENFERVLHLQGMSPNYTLGILSDSRAANFLSYQFMHASVGHLLSNMIFLLIFGALIEPLFGPLLLLISYLGSGVVAAQSFLMFSEVVNSPLVGASGSISGLIALYCIAAFKKNIRYFYFLFIPRPEYMGFVYLPSWLLLFFWFMSDLAGFLSQVSEHSGVAYVAHMGGQVAGAIVALTMLFLWKIFNTKEARIKGDEAVGKLVPLNQIVRSEGKESLISFLSPPRP